MRGSLSIVVLLLGGLAFAGPRLAMRVESFDPFEGASELPKVKQVPACPGCTCGCQDGEECTCSQMRAKKKAKAVRSTNYHYETTCGPGGCSTGRVYDVAPVRYGASASTAGPVRSRLFRGGFFRRSFGGDGCGAGGCR